MPKRNDKNVDITDENCNYSAKNSSSASSEKTKGRKHNLRPETIVIAGFARLPQSITGKHFSSYIAIEFEIEPSNSEVVDIYCTLLPFVEKEILYQACLGNKIDTGIEKTIEQLDKRFFGTTKRPIIKALEDAYRWYKKSLKAVRNTV
jgi:hypothetical protein